MGDRLTVGTLAQDAYDYYLKNRGAFARTGQCTLKGITDLIQNAINEPLPAKEAQWADVGVVYKDHPGWSLQRLKARAAETVGLEEQFRFFQQFCQLPRGGTPTKIPAAEQPLMCSYFDSKWQTRFPTRHNSTLTKSIIPLRPGTPIQDADSKITCFDEPGGECHEARFAGVDTQESVAVNDIVTEWRQKDIGSVPKNWRVKDTYCYKHPRMNENSCVLHVDIPNTKITRQANRVWSGLVRLVNAKNPALAQKIKSKSFKEAIAQAGALATMYRGQIATRIIKHLDGYAVRNGERGGAEPSYAVPNAWDKAKQYQGKLEGVGLYGRLILWSILRDKPNLLLAYLVDDKYGLSAYAAGELKRFYLFNRAQIEKQLGAIYFKKFGITPVEAKVVKELFMSMVIDPSVVFSAARTKQMARNWGKFSTETPYKYTNNVNMFILYTGLGTNTGGTFSNIRSRNTWFLNKTAAEERNGLFASAAFFQAYATKAQRDAQLGQK